MSTLTKVLVILIFLVSAGTVAILGALYGQRVDWHDKFIKEVNQHHYSIQVLRAEAEAKQVQIENLQAAVRGLKQSNFDLRGELESKQTIVETRGRQITDLSAKFTALLQHADALNRNLNTLIATQQELAKANAALRIQRDQAKSASQQATADLFQLRGKLDKVMKDLNTAEREFISASRQLTKLKGIIDRLRTQGIQVDVLPVPFLTAKVRGAIPDLGVVVITGGKDDGVTPGMKFTVFRGSSFVCTIVIDRVERNWSSGRILAQKMSPRVGDDATNDARRAAAKPGPAQ